MDKELQGCEHLDLSSSAIETSSTALGKIGCHPLYLQKCNNKATPTSQPTRNLAGPKAFRACLHKAMQHHAQSTFEPVLREATRLHTQRDPGAPSMVLDPHWFGMVPC